jgi:hypothetical protein
MKFLRVFLVALFSLPLVAGCMSSEKGGIPMGKMPEPIHRAWRSWRNGDVEIAEKQALDLPDSPERAHVLFNCAFAKGEYRQALERYAELPSSYANLSSLDQPVIDAYLHMDRCQEAADFARSRKVAKWLRAALELSAAKPLRVELARTSIVPFVCVPLMGIDLSDSLPGVAAELEGKEVVVHFDSGGSYLVMRPDRARSMGIELIEGPRSFASLSWSKSYYGIAKRLEIGGALLENVPVYGAPQLSMDKIFFGTNILERFFATVDFPARRLILSPRGEPAQKKEHYALLPDRRKEVPFHLWCDHYMFARGGMGDEKSLNWFIDSGLFFLVPDEKGSLHRGSLMAARESCLRWGMKPEDAKKGYFEYPRTASLGPIAMEGPYVIAGSLEPITKEADNFGGVRIDGLLSNGFLGNHSWTIDFDRRVFIFSSAE